jgi:hypothetical protein
MAARLLVLCADCFFDASGREKMLGGLADSRGQQPDYLCHWIKNRATGLNSGKSVLHYSLRGQPSNVAQGRVLPSRSARRFAVTTQAGHHAGFHTLNQLLNRLRTIEQTSPSVLSPKFTLTGFKTAVAVEKLPSCQ